MDAAAKKQGKLAGDSSWNHFHKALIEADEEATNGRVLQNARVLSSIFGADSGTRFGNTALHFACSLQPTR